MLTSDLTNNGSVKDCSHHARIRTFACAYRVNVIIVLTELDCDGHVPVCIVLQLLYMFIL